jgi:hypothetical protein
MHVTFLRGVHHYGLIMVAKSIPWSVCACMTKNGMLASVSPPFGTKPGDIPMTTLWSPLIQNGTAAMLSAPTLID